MEKMTLKDAVRYWVRGFSAIPQEIVTKAYPSLEEDGLHVLATDRECCYCGSTEFTACGGEEEGDDDVLTCDNCGRNDFGEKYDLPMWGTMWTFEESLDAEWATENLDIMRDCGFWVYESDELGVLIGIDGAGYDFYESHWIPLYKARGLRWHTED